MQTCRTLRPSRPWNRLEQAARISIRARSVTTSSTQRPDIRLQPDLPSPTQMTLRSGLGPYTRVRIRSAPPRSLRRCGFSAAASENAARAWVLRHLKDAGESLSTRIEAVSPNFSPSESGSVPFASRGHLRPGIRRSSRAIESRASCGVSSGLVRTPSAPS